MDTNDTKDFEGWIKLKEKLHNGGGVRAIRTGDVWWCAMGENVGTEINGKSKRFSRPVLVLRKFSRYSFWGVPLTSKQHKGSWYVSFGFQEKIETAALTQLKLISVSRLYDRIGKIPNSDLDLVRNGIIKLLLEED